MLPYRSDGPDIARFTATEGRIEVPTQTGPGGSTWLAGTHNLDTVSLVGETLEGQFGEGDDRSFGRQPRRVVPLRWDDLQGGFVEVERVTFADDTLVLAKRDATTKVETHLEQYARPGWSNMGDVPGLPDGWTLYRDVQIVATSWSTTHLDLLPITPRASGGLSLRGGFVLPGMLRKWSTLAPPEIVAQAPGAESIAVQIYRGTRVDIDELVTERTINSETLVLPLADRGLGDGEYLVTMRSNGATRPDSTALLRLRSADSPQFDVDDTDLRLVYSPDATPLWPLRAGPADWPRYVNGTRTVSLTEAGEDLTVTTRDYFHRRRAIQAPPRPPARVGIPVDSKSCMVTGKHRFDLPDFGKDAPRTTTIEGECTTCGLVKRFAGSPWAAKKRDKLHLSQTTSPVTIPPVAEDGKGAEVALDALSHVGHGSRGVFERIAAQIEGSGLFADTLLRRLEVLGHIDVARDERLEASEWALNSPTLTPVADDTWVLTGTRSRSLIEQIRRATAGCAEVRQQNDFGIARVEVEGDLPLNALAEIGVTVLVTSPAPTIARSLPTMSTLEAALKRVRVPFYRTAERWDTGSATWLQSDRITVRGAYRLRDFASTYVVRNEQDLENGTMGIGTARVVKHVANMWAADPLMGYHQKTGSVLVPLGADLPALYGRALSLCSGHAPREFVDQRMLVYRSVPREVADLVYARVSL